MDASRRPRVHPIVRHSARILGSAIGRRRVVVGNSRIMQSCEGWKGENGSRMHLYIHVHAGV